MRDFYLYNSLSRRKEKLEPLAPPEVTLYCCGPTVYDFAHIGNFRTFTFEDILRRSLALCGWRVREVMNLTDVDDKTIAGAERAGLPLRQYTDRFIEAFFADLDELRIQRAEHYPRATDMIPEIIALVQSLLDKDHAYVSGGSVYFRLDSFPQYGRLSGVDRGGILDGARVDNDSYDKESARDFVLWKGDREESVGWESPFGRGRPGWHIECSAMSMKYFGPSLDLHCGGVDLMFPHHENEIAQSEAATGRQFVKYWVHAEHLLVEGRKMSKSLGNFYTFRQLREKGHSAASLRYLLASTHYRSQLNFTFEALQAAASAVNRLRDFKVRLDSYHPIVANYISVDFWCLEEFRARLADDLSVGEALAHLFDFVHAINRRMDVGSLGEADRNRALRELAAVDGVLDVLRPDGEVGSELEKYIEGKIEERIRARRERDFRRADAIRDELLERGVILEDTPGGTRWKIRQSDPGNRA
ncbi:cysteine--tRNA ligase [bacterium]|nr:cysteine--tRNA ligase [bacterium]